MRRFERPLREILSDWHFWMVLAYFGIVGTVVFLFFVRDSANRAATVRQSEARARAAQCVAGIPTLKKVNRFVMGVEEFHKILAENNRAVVKATPRSDPQYKVRLRNYRRVVKTVADVSGVRLHVPTRSECAALGHT